MTSGAGIFYDGSTSERHDVAVTLLAAALRVADAQDRVLAEWPYVELECMSAPDNVLRLGRRDNPDTARLEVRDPDLMTAIDIKAEGIDRTGGLARRQRAVVTAWIAAATVSLVLVAWLGVPVIAERLAPLIPAQVPKPQIINGTVRVAPI
jgi:hypothetical protein